MVLSITSVLKKEEVTDLKQIGATAETGTKVTFKPDLTIFTHDRGFQWDILAKRLRELAFLNRGVKITLKKRVNCARRSFQI